MNTRAPSHDTAPEPPCPYPTEPCRKCHQPMFWAVTERSLRSIPVNPQPTPDGNLQLIPRTDGRPPMVRSLNTAERFGKTSLHLSHFATCPHAQTFRQRRTTKGTQ